MHVNVLSAPHIKHRIINPQLEATIWDTYTSRSGSDRILNKDGTES